MYVFNIQWHSPGGSAVFGEWQLCVYSLLTAIKTDCAVTSAEIWTLCFYFVLTAALKNLGYLKKAHPGWVFFGSGFLG